MKQWDRIPGRVGSTYLSWASQTLTNRDWALLDSVLQLRIATGRQLERLHFSDLSGRSRAVVRWRVLKRLVDARLLSTLDQPAHRRRSAVFEYVLGSAGEWLARARADGHAHRLVAPGDRYVAHALDITELYVELVEQLRDQAEELSTFAVEPAQKDGLGGQLKPDAYLAVRSTNLTDYWWFEIDEQTESLPTIRRKLVTYLDFLGRSQVGPDGVMPRIMITVPTAARRGSIQAEIAGLPPPADQLFRVVLFPDTVGLLLRILRN
ncbi:MAG TPA: replication-relaxation family protein [Pseudonocardiaceae bacterium]|jgi:hypothetical protein|nr:replication-relaxation family protein [Pseudonocardiaceae bacterium]